VVEASGVLVAAGLSSARARTAGSAAASGRRRVSGVFMGG
jgi:hypothetical protein